MDQGDAFAYFQRVSAEPSSGPEMLGLAEDLTVGETYFFRHPDQFRAFTEVVLLPRLQGAEGGSRLRVLSAGCASGEEAYSVAILLKQHVPAGSPLDVQVIGVDVNAAAVAKANRAQYSAWSLRGVSAEIRQQYFQGDKSYGLDKSVRSLVTFQNRNLLDDASSFWQAEQFDVIFCRNVMMYFTPDAFRQVIARLTRSLVYGGYLFLGPAETLRGISQDYHLRHTHETFYYQRRFPEERPTLPRFEAPIRTTLYDTYLPLLASGDGSWVGAISQASERIARLSREMPINKPTSADSAPSAPGKPGISARSGARQELQAAREMMRQERFTEALGVLHALSPDEGRDPDAALLRAVILTNRGDVAEAEKLCHQVLAGDELNAEAHYLLALCREHGQEYVAAIEQDQTAIYLDRQFAMPHLHLGLLSKRQGDADAARRAFQEALDLLPREDASRILLFGGGLSREMLINLCTAEVQASGGPS